MIKKLTPKKPLKKLKRPAMPGAGRPKTGQKEWENLNIQKSTKLLLKKIQKEKDFKSLDDLILSLISDTKIN